MYFDVANYFILVWNIHDFLDRGVGMKNFLLSDLISLPLAPTITGVIADYLQLMTQEFCIHISPDDENIMTERSPECSWHWYFERSIRQAPTIQYQYVSTIAHRLAAKSLLTPLEICHSLQRQIPAAIIDTRAQLKLDCWYNDAGYIYFQLTPEAIATWLDYIHDLPLDIHRHGDRSLASVTIGLYAHARCCSLLKLADVEKLVAITANWQISTPNWSICRSPEPPQNQPIAPPKIIFEHPCEHRLIHAFMEVLDGIYGHSLQLDSPAQILLSAAEVDRSTAKIIHQNSLRKNRSPNWTKLTIDLAQSWLEFYRHCRIFGDLQHQNPQLAVARCGLTAISRRYLQVLLENYLGISALVEL